MHVPPYLISAGRIAELVRFGCERQFRYASDLAARPAESLPSEPVDGTGLLREAGRRWERTCIRVLIRRFGRAQVIFGGWDEAGAPRRVEAERWIAGLRPYHGVRLIVQPEVRVPASLALEYGGDATKPAFAVAVPDAIVVIRTRRGVKLQLLELKASGAPRLAHYAQVAYHAIVLEEVCRTEPTLADVGVDLKRGRLWARDGRGPRHFPLASYLRLVRRTLRDDMPRIAATARDAAAWHVGPACAGCAYVTHCSSEAERTDDLCRIVGLTPLAKQALNERGISSVAALAMAGGKRDVFVGTHSLEADALRLRQRAQALAFGKVFDVERSTALMPASEGVRLLLAVEHDPVTQRCFALGFSVAGAGGVHTEVRLARRRGPRGEREMLAEFMAALEAAAIAAAGGAGRPPSFHAYLYDRRQLSLLRELLQRHSDDPAVSRRAVAMLRRLGTLTAHPASAAAGTLVRDVVEQLFALPVAHDYDLAAVSACLQPRDAPRPFAPPPGFADAYTGALAFARIHELWRARTAHPDSAAGAAVRDGLVRALEEKLLAIDSVVRAVRERAARGDRLRLRKVGAPAAGADETLRDAQLERLRGFCLTEAAADAAATAALHAQPSAERARRGEAIAAMELVERRADGSLVFEYAAGMADPKFRQGDFALLLGNDDGGPVVADGAREHWRQRARMVELVEYLEVDGAQRVVLAAGAGLARAERDGDIDLDRLCVLDRAAIDFNTSRLLRTLASLDADDAACAAVRALLGGARPGAWSPDAPPLGDTAAAVIAAAGARRGGPVLSAEQELVRRGVHEQPVTLVWGPPGTGKTHLLAWTLVGLAAAAASAGRPCRVLVTAATHRAVANLMTRIAGLTADAAVAMRLLKLRGAGSESDVELAAAGVELVPDDRAGGHLGAARPEVPTVIGATVWSVWKQLRDAAASDADPLTQPWFDVVVVDEASQMKVAEACIALSAMAPHARLVLCGDDRQLAPIVRTRQALGDDPLFGSVFGHFARHFPRAMLRESRRMNAALVAYPAELFYPGLVSLRPDGRLAIDAAPAADPVDALLLDAFLRPEDAVVLCSYDGVRAGASNAFEAWLAARLVRLARERLRDAAGEPLDDERFRGHGVAVVSPHRAQGSAILAGLRAAGFAPGSIPVVDTVERMQGNEREMIVVSYAVADAELAEREAEFLLDPNRFNVAITRARSKLIVLCSAAVLNVVPRDEWVMDHAGVVQGYADHCRDAVLELTLEGPLGPVAVRLHYRRTGGQGTG